MRTLRISLSTTAAVVFGSLAVAPLPAAAQGESPHDWLSKMSRAVQTTNYEGTVIRMRDDWSDTLKIVHVVTDGVIREKIVVQEGNGLEIIRNGNEVQCILPDKKSVLVEEWDENSALFSALPSADLHFGGEYDVLIERKDRVAGRKAIVVKVKPHDEFRFEHRIWLDTKTGFPLQTKLIGIDGDPIEQVKFADITLDREIHASALKPANNIEGFRWITEPRRHVTRDIETEWSSAGVPAGFRVVSSHQDDMQDSDGPVTHMLLTDGIANVSVFIEPGNGKHVARRSRVGASNSYSVATDGYVITAIGDVPAVTVEQIASSMQRR